MINKKFLAVLSAFSMLSSLCIANVTVAAATDTEPYSFEYVETGDSTKKQIDIYYAGSAFDKGIWTGELYVTFDINTISDVTLTASIASEEFEGDNSRLSEGGYNIMWMGADAEPVTAADKKIGSMVLTVPEGTGAFNMTVDIDSSFLCDASEEPYMFEDAVVVAIPALATEPDTVPFESATAEYIDTFADDTDALPVAAWFATIDWSQYDEVKALNWELTVGGETKTVPESSETVVTGEMTVVYGLAIAGQATQLETIDKDNVVLK